MYKFKPVSSAGAKNPPLMNQVCYGYDLSAINIKNETKNQLQLKWLLNAYALYNNKSDFFLASGFFNKLAGSDVLMQQIKSGKTIDEIRDSWKPELDNFKKIRKKYLIYSD
ncbi:MAG: DUF1343 domain-containing protein [Bacteroidetes bacterium]|nr:DUF1343 domain-containing protein [Bacteroidota bacterium]